MDIIENRCLPHYVAQRKRTPHASPSTRTRQREGRGATYGNTHSIYGLYTHTYIYMYVGRVVCVCMYLHLFLGWHTNRFFAHSSHGDDVVVMFPFFFLFAIVYALSNKRTNTHTHTYKLHAYTRVLIYERLCVYVYVFAPQDTTCAQQ